MSVYPTSHIQPIMQPFSIDNVAEEWRRILIPILTLPSWRYEDERTVFLHFKVKLKEMARFHRYLSENHMAQGGQSRTFSNEEPLELHPEVWFQLLTTLSKAELDEAVCISQADRKLPAFVAFIGNIVAIREGRPLQPMPQFEYQYYESEFWGQIRHFVVCILINEEGAPYLPLIPQGRLIQHLLRLQPYFAFNATNLSNLAGLKQALRAAGTPQAVELHDWLELQFAFTKSGHPRARLAAMLGGTSSSSVMEAVALMAENQDEKAMQHMKQALRLQSTAGRTFAYPLENFLYGLLLWRLREKGSVSKLTLSLLKLKKIESEECVPLCLLLKIATQDEPAVYASLAVSIIYPHTKLAGLFGLIVEAFKIKTKLPEKWHAALMNCSTMPWFGFELDSLRERTGERFKTSSEELGMDPLMPLVSVKPEWQKRLEHLITLQSADEAKTVGAKSLTAGKEVLACLVNMTSLEVTLALRKTKDDEHFSKGRAVSVAGLASGRITAATPQDKGLATLAEEDWTPNGSRTKVLQGPAVIRALIGHPYVFDAKNPDKRITVTRTALQIAARIQKDGTFKLESNVHANQITAGWSSFISYAGEDTLGVIEPTDAQRKLLQSMTGKQGSNCYPAEATDLLKTLLEKLSVNTTVMSELLKDSEKLEHLAGDPRTVFRIEPSAEGFDITATVRPVQDLSFTAKPGRGQQTIAMNVKGKPVQIERNTVKEADNFAALEQKLTELDACRTSDFNWSADTEACLRLLSVVRDEPERAAVEWPEGEAFRVNRTTIDVAAMKLSSRRMGEWFEIEGEVRLDEKTVVSVAKLLELLHTATGGFIRLGEKEFVELSAALRAKLAALSDAAGKKSGRSKADAVNVSIFRADVFDAIEDESFEIDADKASRALLARLADAKNYEPEVPKGLQAELRDYQVEGFCWMSRLAAWGAGSILADDMGLGKTVQAIALLLDRAKLGPQLVVMPTAVLVNWEHEIARFAPGLNVRVFNREDRTALVKSIKAGDVVLTSYGVLTSEIELLKGVTWQTVVLDEAHTVKNRATKMSKAVMMLQADCRVLLTGTPLQNRLSEIWNLFRFANPGLLGTYDDFVERFITPIETHQDRAVRRKLKRLVSPFILRRTKAEVLDELPEKTELTIRVTLSDAERALYESFRERASVGLESGEINPIQALAELTKLRQAACHPELVDPKLKIASSKTAAFLSLAEELRESGHRALVFSQFTSHLALVKRELDARGIEYLYLDGSDTASKRAQLVDEFRQGDAPLFLISLKAGGTGLNLTAADYVIHLDPWWNPAIENQASDRVYRIGQDRPVTIYRLIAENTIEEKILRLHETKKSLADALLEGADMSSRLTKDEILKLLMED